MKPTDLDNTKPTLHTGGAYGADAMFERFAREQSFNVKSYSFSAHRSQSLYPVILTPAELAEGLLHVSKANKLLKRRVPHSNKYVLNLLCRNWFQVKNSSVIFAAALLNQETHLVEGGTGWAIAMAMQNEKPIYVFDMKTNQWFHHNGNWIKIGHPFTDGGKFPDNFAGIGSRDLTLTGQNAIMELFQFNKSK